MPLTLTTAQTDRAAGVLLALAAGDALGAGYEFGPPLGDDVEVAMAGGGELDWGPGEWTDDTSMTVPIAEAAADGLDLRSTEAQNRIVARWLGWSVHASTSGSRPGRCSAPSTDPGPASPSRPVPQPPTCTDGRGGPRGTVR